MSSGGHAESPTEDVDTDPWERRFYYRDGDGTGFDRVVFFSDAVFAIALTLMAVEIGIPETPDSASPSALWSAIVDKGPALLAYLVAFFWVAVYWRANHRFTGTLNRMSGRYIGVVLVFLALIALLPFTASMLGEYPNNPVAVVVFAVFAAVISSLEVVLILVADRDGLFLRPLTAGERRYRVLGACTPLPGFLLSIPVAFASTTLAVVCWFAGSVLFGWATSKLK
ncbi:MAG: DUF1211 domain-containing protein [Actinobacteria bacterium]|nr:DUF1211 domain-containing protein [Actinomycetota bacterium]